MDSLSKHNNGYKYILTVIDVLSKYAWIEPLKTKTGESLVEAFSRIIKEQYRECFTPIRERSLPINNSKSY